MNTDWFKKFENSINTAIPKVKQATENIITHVELASKVAVATLEKEQIPQHFLQKINSTWATAKAEWANRKSTQNTDNQKLRL